jgi:hypothetical protein
MVIMKAIAKLTKQCDAATIESPERGWLLHFAARIALDWGKKEHALELQQRAFTENKNLSRPPTGAPKVEIILPAPQAQQMVKQLKPFRYKRECVAQFEETVALLVPNSSGNQFEQAMADLGTTLGFETSQMVTCLTRPAPPY